MGDIIYSNLSKFHSLGISYIGIFSHIIDENNDLANQLNIRTIPTFFFFKNGKLVSSCGGLPKNQFIDKINESFNYHL